MNRRLVTVRGYPLTSVSGLLVILLYCAFTLSSRAFYPFEYGPMTHYLSRLGNFDYSPAGAYLYNIGCILTGIGLVPFFIGMVLLFTESRVERALLMLGQFLGTCSGAALLLIGVFSEDQGAPHMLASSIFFEINFVVLILVGLALLFHGIAGFIAGTCGVAVSLSSLVLAVYVGGPIVEWYTVFASLGFVALVAILTHRVHRESLFPGPETRL